MMTPAEMLELLRELDALEKAQAAIARPDLAEDFLWRCVAVAIRERRARLIQHAEHTLRGETLGAESSPPAVSADVPGRVH